MEQLQLVKVNNIVQRSFNVVLCINEYIIVINVSLTSFSQHWYYKIKKGNFPQ